MRNRSFLYLICNTWVVFKTITPLLFFIIILNGCAAHTGTAKPALPPIVSAPAAPPAQEAPAPKKWQCNPQADQAMADDDIETGLHEHARFVAQHPENPLAHYHLGYAFGQMGEVQQEIAHYETALSLGYMHDGQFFFNLAMAYAESNQYDKAIDAFEKALTLDPDSIDALTELSSIYKETGDLKNERRVLKRRLELEPDNRLLRQRLNQLSGK